MRTHPIFVALVCAQATFACDGRETGLKPIGGVEVSPAEVERFVRRAHLDMLGRAASDEFVGAKRDALIGAGNTAEARAEIASELIADPGWGIAVASELESRAFDGGYEFAYNFLCANSRQANPQCSSCTANQDPCQGCTCAAVTGLLDERTGIEDAASDLTSGVSIGEVERRFADSQGYRFGRATESLAANLFDDFLNRAAEPDELANATALIIGFVAAPGNAAGLLFHRHGANFADLIDIIFTSEVYAEAVVSRAFERLLGRGPTPAELTHFTKDLDPVAINTTAVLTAIVSSGEYFRQ